MTKKNDSKNSEQEKIYEFSALEVYTYIGVVVFLVCFTLFLIFDRPKVESIEMDIVDDTAVLDDYDPENDLDYLLNLAEELEEPFYDEEEDVLGLFDYYDDGYDYDDYYYFDDDEFYY